MIGPNNPPKFYYGVFYWERSLDPWHKDAYPVELKENAPHQDDIRQQGWMAIDYGENPVGFIPDGSDNEVADQFELRLGEFGHMCAYPNTKE